MDMTGEYRIAAPRQVVWEALNDPETLKASIPGCDELVKKSDTELEAKVTAKVGPVKARFGGAVTLTDLDPPKSYRITGQGSGGAAGFAKGGAKVDLAEDGDGTILRYEASADVGGKLAQIGSRLIQGTAKKMADDFFGTFSRLVAERAAAAAPLAPAPAATAVAPVEPVPPPVVTAVEPVPVPPQPASAGPDPVHEVEVEPDAAILQPALVAEPSAMAPPPVHRSAGHPLPPADKGGWAQSPLTWIGGILLLILLLYLILS